MRANSFTTAEPAPYVTCTPQRIQQVVRGWQVLRTLRTSDINFYAYKQDHTTCHGAQL